MKISAQLIIPLEIVNDAYSFTMPVAFYPNYNILGADLDENYPYEFSYAILIKSIEGINTLSIPAEAEVEYDIERKYATIFSNEPDRSINIFYKVNEMADPQLTYATNDKFPGEVAASISFVPTFEAGEDTEATTETGSETTEGTLA